MHTGPLGFRRLSFAHRLALTLVGCSACVGLGCGGSGGRRASGGLTGLTGSAGGTSTAGSDGGGGGSEGTSSPSGSAGNETGSTTGGGSGGATSGASKFDLGTFPDAPQPPENACGAVDFLFIIDNSGSMAFHQANLINNFPTFIGGIQGLLPYVSSYQVGVVTTDRYSFNVAGCQEYSSLVVKTGGLYSSVATCGPFAEGANYMTEADDLVASFNCAGKVGVQGGDYELPMMVLEETVKRVEGGPGECNEGFLRDDSLWVIVIITDEADGEGDPEGADVNPQGGPSTSPGTPQSWFDTVVAARQGEEGNAVVLSLIQYAGSPCFLMGNTPQYDATHIKEFTEMFTYGFVGLICAQDYGPYFSMATSIIADACETFQPPG